MKENIQFRFEDVSFAFPESHPTLLHASLELERGSFVLIGGPSGSGKSTMLRLFNRLLEPQYGAIYYEGKALDEYSPMTLRREVVTVGQIPTLVPGNVRDNLLLPFAFRANSGLTKPDDTKLLHWMERLLLRGVKLTDKASSLSVGQRQRLCLIRTLLLEPKVMLMDEPTSALDPESRQIVEKTAEGLCREQGTTIIMVTHLLFELEKIRPMLLHLEGGKLECRS